MKPRNRINLTPREEVYTQNYIKALSDMIDFDPTLSLGYLLDVHQFIPLRLLVNPSKSWENGPRMDLGPFNNFLNLRQTTS